jgi:hypothetical protein
MGVGNHVVVPSLAWQGQNQVPALAILAISRLPRQLPGNPLRRVFKIKIPVYMRQDIALRPSEIFLQDKIHLRHRPNSGNETCV